MRLQGRRGDVSFRTKKCVTMPDAQAPFFENDLLNTEDIFGH